MNNSPAPSVDDSLEGVGSGTSPHCVSCLCVCDHDHAAGPSPAAAIAKTSAKIAVSSSSKKKISTTTTTITTTTSQQCNHDNVDVDVDAMLKELARLKKDCANHAKGGVFEETVTALITSVEKKIQFRKDVDRLKKSCMECSSGGGGGSGPMGDVSNDRFAPLLHSLEHDSPGANSAKSFSKSNKHQGQTDSPDAGNKTKKVSVPSIQGEIRALLVTNAELFYRCIASMEDEVVNPFEDKDQPEEEGEDENDDDSPKASCEVSFSRYGYDTIKVRTSSKTRDDGTTSSTTCLTTDADCTTKKFDMTPLARLPPALTCYNMMPQYKSEPYSNFINFEAIFESALFLRDDILQTFLPKLKTHLTAVQSCLHQVDTWLTTGSNSTINYIHKTFGIQLCPPSEYDYCGSTCTCTPGTHSKSYICFTCQCPLRFHKEGRCPKANTYFQCKKFHTLKKFTTTLSSYTINNNNMMMSRTFDIGKVSDRMALEKFLDCIDRGDYDKEVKQVVWQQQDHHQQQHRESIKSCSTLQTIGQYDVLQGGMDHEVSTPGSDPIKMCSKDHTTSSTTDLSSLETMESELDGSKKSWSRLSFKGFLRKSSSRSSLKRSSLG